MLYREGFSNINAERIQTDRTLSPLNQDFVDLAQKVNFHVAREAPLSKEKIKFLGARLRQLGSTPITTETFKISMAPAIVRPTEWQVIIRGVERLKRFKPVIIDVINKWTSDFEKQYPSTNPKLMPRSITDDLETELGASTLEMRTGRRFLVFYPLAKARSGSALPSPGRRKDVDLTRP